MLECLHGETETTQQETDKIEVPQQDAKHRTTTVSSAGERDRVTKTVYKNTCPGQSTSTAGNTKLQ